MKLHQNKELFRQAITFTAQQINLREIYVEKDYWVTYALYSIFKHPIGKETVFKGGTALSKCYSFIDRFSEDIDLVVFRSQAESNNQLTNKIKTISKVVSRTMPEVKVNGITVKKGMNRKTGHSYEKTFKGDYGQVRDVIIVEATWLGYYEPYSTKNIHSYIYDMMMATGQHAMIKEYGLEPFPVQVLDARRTLCEKIMSLVRFSYGKDAISDLKQKIRHTYDLHQLLRDAGLKAFFESEAFSTMLGKVAQDDVASYRNNNEWLKFHPSESLLFRDLENVWEQIKDTYLNDFRLLVYGNFPEEREVLASLTIIYKRLTSLDWGVTVDNG